MRDLSAVRLCRLAPCTRQLTLMLWRGLALAAGGLIVESAGLARRGAQGKPIGGAASKRGKDKRFWDRVSAVVGSPTRQNALDDDQLRLDVAREAHAPVADANTELRASGQAANVESGVSGRNSIDCAQHAVPDLRVEGA